MGTKPNHLTKPNARMMLMVVKRTIPKKKDLSLYSIYLGLLSMYNKYNDEPVLPG